MECETKRKYTKEKRGGKERGRTKSTLSYKELYLSRPAK